MAVADYLLPTSADEAVRLLAEGGRARPMAGGTWLMPALTERQALADRVVGLRRAGLDGVTVDGGRIRLGATTTLSALIAAAPLPVLVQAASEVGGWAVRNMATVAGNLLAPNPAGDLAVALLALGAQAEVLDRDGARTIDVDALLRDGLPAGALVTAVTLPVPEGRVGYLKLGRRAANTPAVVTAAVHLQADGGRIGVAAVALHGVADRPVRSSAAEDALRGATLDPDVIDRAAAAAVAAVDPPDDPVASGWYRRRMIGVVLRRVLTDIVSRG